MSFKNVMKVVASLAMLAILAGCTITGEPRMNNVAFDKDGYIIKNEFQESIAIGEVSDFPGTSNFTYSGKIAPNFSNESFKEALEASLKNVNLHGDVYSLNAKLIDSGDWSDWFELSLGDKSRKIQIEYSLEEQNGNSIFSKIIESEVVITNYSPITPYYITQRKAAEKSYAQNIEKLIEEINNL